MYCEIELMYYSESFNTCMIDFNPIRFKYILYVYALNLYYNIDMHSINEILHRIDTFTDTFDVPVV